LMLALVLAACSGGGGGGGMIAGEDVVIRMFDNRFEYTEIQIPVGGSVAWLGAGRNPHNAVAVDGSWSTETVFGSLEQLEGDVATLVFETAGTYPFFCTLHGNADGDGMAGTLIVGDG
ncbi:MAG: plastocyanin/azurin family copper-binding protein, partial [Actinobacteria bacterium]|nr:plastocyanin/azurin family copper-binding protein [Actinomycetota bacterium]